MLKQTLEGESEGRAEGRAADVGLEYQPVEKRYTSNCSVSLIAHTLLIFDHNYQLINCWLPCVVQSPPSISHPASTRDLGPLSIITIG